MGDPEPCRSSGVGQKRVRLKVDRLEAGLLVQIWEKPHEDACSNYSVRWEVGHARGGLPAAPKGIITPTGLVRGDGCPDLGQVLLASRQTRGTDCGLDGR